MLSAALFLGISCALLASAFPEETSYCSQGRRQLNLQSCLSGIGSAAENTARYWFGTNFYDRCPNGPTMETSECFVPPNLEIPQSISSLLFTPGTFQPSDLDRYMDVVYTSQPGSYFACGNEYFSDHVVKFTANPLLSRTVDAWETRDAPRITWRYSPGEYYTLVMKDVGYGFLHALYINVPGNDLNRAQAILPYVRPGNPSRFGNVYVFLLYPQNSLIQLDPRYNNISGPQPLNVSEFAQVQNLEGPVAMNWVLVTGDPYAVERAVQRGAVNNCPRFIKDAIRGPRTRSFLPSDNEYSVFVNVTYFSNDLFFTSCCSSFFNEAKNVSLNPIGHGAVMAVHARYMPKVELYPSIVYFNRETGFGAKRYTLLMVDADFRFPSDSASDKPLIHWLIIDIPDGKVNHGKEVVSYLKPSPLDLGFHYYYFLLYEQNGNIWDENSYLNYVDSDCREAIAGRCYFDVPGYVMANSLKLVGASWMAVGADEFVRYSRVNWGEREEEVCAEAPDYTPDCTPLPAGSQRPSIHAISMMPILMFFADISRRILA